MEKRIFISHSSKDHEVAKGICDALEENGHRCWIAPRDIPYGTQWAGEISKAIDFDTHYNWLWYMYGIVNDEAYKLILGYIKDKKIVLFTGEEKGRIDRSILGVEDVMKLRKICKNKFGLGNYKIYNGIKYNEEKNRYDALGTIIDFDIRQDEK